MKLMFSISVLCLAIGVGVIFGYCNGSTSMSAGDAISSFSIHLDITTKGVPVLIGIPLTIFGAGLLMITWLVALFKKPARQVQEDEPPRRHEELPKT